MILNLSVVQIRNTSYEIWVHNSLRSGMSRPKYGCTCRKHKSAVLSGTRSLRRLSSTITNVHLGILRSMFSCLLVSFSRADHHVSGMQFAAVALESHREHGILSE